MSRPARVAVIYYSATGNVHRLAHAVAEGAEAEAAEVRLRHVEEFASELLISQNQHWGRHRSEVEDEPVATLDDLEWADGIAFGTPTRFGNVSAQLKQFMDQAGRLWQEGKLADRVGTAFTASMTAHGGQESTILALNNTPLPLGHAHPPARLHSQRGLQCGRQSVRHLVHEREERRWPGCEGARGRPLSGTATRSLRDRGRGGTRGGCFPCPKAKARALPCGRAPMSRGDTKRGFTAGSSFRKTGTGGRARVRQ